MSSTRGPLPKRNAERAGHNAKRELAEVIHSDEPVIVPPPHRGWHLRTRQWYESLALSVQSRYFEPSDWQHALIVGDMLEDLLQSGDPSAALFKTILGAMDDLGVTEGARRRMRIEAERPDSPQIGGKPNAAQAAREALENQFERLRVVDDGS